MTTSYNTECHIERLIEELNGYVEELRSGLEIIRALNAEGEMERLRSEVKSAKERAKEWMK